MLLSRVHTKINIPFEKKWNYVVTDGLCTGCNTLLVSSILRDVRGRNPVSWTKTLRKKTEKSKGDLMKQKRVEQSFKAKAFDELFDDLFGLVRVATNAVCTL